MNDNKKKRFPADRLKLHALLDKRKKELADLQAEVDEIEELVLQADRTAIHATTELYNVTPEKLTEILRNLYGSRDEVSPELPNDLKKVPVGPEGKEELHEDEET